VVIRRVRYECRKTGRNVYPLDGILDLPSGEVTVSVAKRALRLATRMSFVDLQEELVAQHDVHLSDAMLDELMQKAGGVAEQDRRSATDELLSLSRGVQREDRVPVALSGPLPKRLYVSCDGVMYRTRYREPDAMEPDKNRLVFQEMKAGTVFWQGQDGRWHKRVMGCRETPERFGLSLWGLAASCGMLQAEEVIFISDGGTWCTTVAETYFKDAIRILDWYHLSEHVWEAGRELYTDEQAAKRWVEDCLDHLHDSSGIGLLRHLQRCRARRPSTDQEILDRLIGYLEPRVAITDYVDYRGLGYVIGSGMMESTCKQLVSQRLKGTGMQWSESGALAMTALIAHRINGTWDRFWCSRPLQRIA